MLQIIWGSWGLEGDVGVERALQEAWEDADAAFGNGDYEGRCRGAGGLFGREG